MPRSKCWRQGRHSCEQSESCSGEETSAAQSGEGEAIGESQVLHGNSLIEIASDADDEAEQEKDEGGPHQFVIVLRLRGQDALCHVRGAIDGLLRLVQTAALRHAAPRKCLATTAA